MTIPKYHELFTTVLQELADGREWRSRDFQQHVVDGMDLSEEERSEKYGGGGNRALGRVYFACEHLYQAGALRRPQKAHWQITDLGRTMLKEHPEGITLSYFADYRGSQGLDA